MSLRSAFTAKLTLYVLPKTEGNVLLVSLMFKFCELYITVAFGLSTPLKIICLRSGIFVLRSILKTFVPLLYLTTTLIFLSVCVVVLLV